MKENLHAINRTNTGLTQLEWLKNQFSFQAYEICLIRGLVNESVIWSPEAIGGRVYRHNIPRCENVMVDYQFKTKSRKTGSTSVVKTLIAGNCSHEDPVKPSEGDNTYIAPVAGGGVLLLIALSGIIVFIMCKKKKSQQEIMEERNNMDMNPVYGVYEEGEPVYNTASDHNQDYEADTPDSFTVATDRNDNYE